MRALVWIVALLALSAVAFYAVQTYPARIEADLKQRSTDALSANNLNFANVTVTGREVTLAGIAPSPTAKEQAVKVAGDVWGVASVHDTLAISVDGQPVTPQSVIATNTPAPHPAEPTSSAAPAAPERPPSGPLPSIGSLVDPALAPPAEPETPPTEEPAAPDSTTPTPQPSPAPAETVAAPPAPTTPPATTQAAAEPPSTPAAAPAQPAPTQPAQAQPEPSQPPPPQTVAAATPPPTTHAAAPAASPATPVGPLPKDALAEGMSAGLNAAIQAIPPALAAAPPAYRLEAHVEGKRIELQGLVSTPSAQRALIAHVRSHIRRAKIVDSLQVAHAKPDKAWLGVARTGLEQLAHLDTGSLKLSGHSVAVSGKPKSERDRSRVLAALGELPKGYTSTVLLERMQDVTPAAPAIAPPPPPTPERVRPPPPRVTEQARPRRATSKPVVASYRTVREPEPVHHGLSSWCRRRFADVLPRVAVGFNSGSWRVDSSLGLDDLARVIRSCPDARLRVTGHSDTQETAPGATGLSLRRAQAVRDELEERGASPAGITTLGRGGLRPAFSNATADGRENNRRVEFAVW